MLRVCGVHSLQIIFGCCCESELCADEILEDCTIVAADRAVRFIADDELEIGGRELVQKSVARSETLDRGHDDLRLLPIVAPLLVNDGLDSVIGQIVAEISLSLFLQLKPID